MTRWFRYKKTDNYWCKPRVFEEIVMDRNFKIKDKPWVDNNLSVIWNLTYSEEQKKLPQMKTTIGAWLVYAPWIHPMWNYHLCYLLHLRPEEGVETPKFQFEGATHEFGVYSVDPTDGDPHTTLAGEQALLEPISIAQQFKVESDAEALSVIEHLLEDHVATGELSIDEDFRHVWHRILAPKERYGFNR